MLFCCLRRNVETSCHKHIVVVSRHQQTPPLTATNDECHQLTTAAAMTTRDEAKDWLKSLFFIPVHLHSTPQLWGRRLDIAIVAEIQE